MDRRSSIKTFLAIAAGVTLIPSCMQDKSKAGILLKNMIISSEQEKVLEELAATILPQTSTPGAKELSSHLFALMMVDECFLKEQQQQFLSGLKDFEQLTKKKFNHNFFECTSQERSELLTGFENNKDDKSEAVMFYRLMKRLTIQSYASSKYYLTNVQVYKLVPGHFTGCIRVAQQS